MRLEITRKSDLAARAVVVLSRAEGLTKAGDLATEIGTTAGFLSQVLTPLAAHQIVRSESGPNGGYELMKDAKTVSLLDVIESIEGPTDTGQCVLADRDCVDPGPCILHGSWSLARSTLVQQLRATTISQLAESG